MANFTITKAFNAVLRKFETTDRNHADVFNAVAEQLINNDAHLKEHTDSADGHIKSNGIHVPQAPTSGAQTKYLRGDGTWIRLTAI